MKVSTHIPSAIVALTALSLASPLAAADEAGKTPVQIKTIVVGSLGPGSGTASGRFTLDLGTSTASGKLTLKYNYPTVKRSAAGFQFRPTERTETFRAKAGTLVIHTIGRELPVGVQNPKDPDGDSLVFIGTWSIVRGTGTYAGLQGGGEVAGLIVISGHDLYSEYFHRYEGLATAS
jgi:hypothetical protein